MKLPAPNRVAVYLTALAGLCTALAPAVANLDVTSTAGIVAGLLAIVAVANKWLSGWQAHEINRANDAPFSGSGTTGVKVKPVTDEIPGRTEGVKAEGYAAPGEVGSDG